MNEGTFNKKQIRYRYNNKTKIYQVHSSNEVLEQA